MSENSSIKNEMSNLSDDPDGKILAIMYCEFDNHEGPKIVYQKPFELVSKSTFEIISSHIIPKTGLRNRMITITINNFKICGFPVYIEHTKYKRNLFIYNTCFIFNESTNTCSYEAVVKKLAGDLRILETECGFLSRFETKPYLPDLLEQIRTSLNNYGECVLQKIGDLEHSSLFLKIIEKHVDPQNVQSFDVPVFVTNMSNFKIDEWDLTTQKIINTINGFKTISMISNETNIEQSVVKSLVQNLIYSDVVALVPLIQYSSMFVITPSINTFYNDEQMQNEAIIFVQLDENRQCPLFVEIFQLYSHFTHNITVKEINVRYNPQEMNIDLRKLILFGLLKGFLRKINKYPMSITDTSQNKVYSNGKKYFNGYHNFDKLCSVFGMSVKALEEQIDEDTNIAICIK